MVMDESLEEKVCLFMDESELCGSHIDTDIDDDLICCSQNNTNSHDTTTFTFYWESQLALLQEILERYQLTGSKLRQEVGQIIKEVKAWDNFCSCFKPNSLDCTTCFRRRVVSVLCHRGFNAKLRTSKWGTTKKFPGGSHEYIEVIASTIRRKKQITFLIELELRDQFQIAKAGHSYQKLVSCLPEFYIGKPEYLAAIVRVVCDAAKKSMKEKKMHMGPWRKSGFMQMKWSGFNHTRTLDKSLDTESFLRISGASPSVVVT